MFGFRIKAVSYWFDSSLCSHTAMERRVAVAARPAEVVWIESLMGCIETGMDPEVKTQLQEISADRHEIFSKRLAEKFQNPSPGWLAHAGLLDTQQPRLKAVWWVFYLDKQLCDKVKEAMTLPPCVPFPAPAVDRPAEVAWIEALMNCIETGMASEVKALLREKADDRHEISPRRLVGNFPNPSLDWLVQAGLLDTQQPKFKDVWWVFYFDKQLCDKVKKSVTMLHYGTASRQASRQRSKLCFKKRQKIVMRSFAGA